MMGKPKTVIEWEKDIELPDHVELPLDYFPLGIGPGGFSPRTMYIHALAQNKSKYVNEMETKSWVVLWLLDHVDWDKVENKTFRKAGSD